MNKPNLICVMALFLSVMVILPELVNAQSIGASKGRSNGVTLELNNNNYDTLKRIRKLISEGEYESASNRAIRFIRGYEGNERSGLEKNDYVKEAYNCLCVSSMAQGKLDYAMEACNQSIDLSPNHWESLKTRATIYFHHKEFQKSLDDFIKAEANSPNEEIRKVLAQNVAVVNSKLN